MPGPDATHARGFLRWGLAILAVAAGLASAGCGSDTHPRPQHPAPAPRAPLQSIFQADVSLRSNPVGVLDTLRGLGVGRVKVYMSWRAIAPDATASSPPPGFAATNPAAYPATAWAPYDAILREAAKRGMAVDLTLGPPAPTWATGPGAPSDAPAGVWKPSASRFEEFVRAVGTRYGGSFRPAGDSSPLPRVDFWGLWNEPNYGPSLAPQAIGSTVELAPAMYRGLLDAAWRGLSATGHGHDTILIGELAPRGETIAGQPGNFSGMVPLRFVRALYCVDASFHPFAGQAALARGCPTGASAAHTFAAEHPILFHASGFSVHPYPQGRIPPNVATTIEPDYADLAAIGNLESTLDRLQAIYGSATRFPIYSTEFGYKTDPPYAPGAPVATAALYLNWAEYISWSSPRIRSYDQYLLTDPPPSVNSSFDTGLEDYTGRPKATLDAFRLPIFLPQPQGRAHQALEVWGCVRPAPYAQHDTGRRQVVAIEFARSPAGPFSVLKRVDITDPAGYFEVLVPFPATGVVRLGWSPPHGPAEHSRLASVTIG